METLNQMWNGIVTWFLGNPEAGVQAGWLIIVKVLAIALIGLLVVKIIVSISKSLVNKTKLRGLAGNFIVVLVKIAAWMAYLICLMGVLGIDTSSAVALLASFSLALSLAVQSTLSNFASGLVLLGNKAFAEGDYVEAGGVAGTVVSIGIFSTKLKTPDNKVITIPNSNVANNNIIDYSTESKRRLDLAFVACYGSDVEFVKSVMTAQLDAHALVLHDEEYTVRLSAQTERALTFTCRCWVNNGDYWTVNFDLMENMTKAFEENGIAVPRNTINVNINK